MRGSVLWLLFVLNSFAGLLWSPVTALRKVRVEGATTQQIQGMQAQAQSLRKIPALRVQQARFLTSILADGSIYRAQWQQNLFGRGVLKIVNRSVCAVVVPKANLMLSGDGTLFTSGSPAQTRLAVRTELPALKPSFTFAGTWEASLVAQMATMINVKIPTLSGTLIQDRAGKITLACTNLAPVVLGTTDNAALKIAALERALAQQPKLLEQVKEVNLSAPENPHYVPLANDPVSSKK